MATHVWNVGMVQNQQFPNRITLVANAGGRAFYVLVTNLGGGPVKVLRGGETAAVVPANQSACIASDADVHLELEEGPRRGATGNFSVVA
ncbi:MAG: hypothetical protein KIT16_03105 [Rhodospirillaceae bacterium]|nr:hypothetical protein [Rhodospirillaceae bacterium]